MGFEWCGPGTARGGEKSVYGTGAAVPLGAPGVGGGAVGRWGAEPSEEGVSGGSGAERERWGRGEAACGSICGGVGGARAWLGLPGRTTVDNGTSSPAAGGTSTTGTPLI